MDLPIYIDGGYVNPLASNCSLKSNGTPNCTEVTAQNCAMYKLDDCPDSIRVWRDSELLDGSLCTKCLEFHGLYAPCIPSSPPADAVSHPARSIKSKVAGALSLHDYRKYLSRSAESIDDPIDRSEKPLKRKTAKSNLNPPPPLSSLSSRTVSVSSAASTPPLSPSRSHSVVSQPSEQESEPEVQPAPSQGPRVHLVSENATRPRPNRKRLNTFREKRDQMLANDQAVATISLGGASFEILNPRESLDFARIVSFIEDGDTCSLLSMDAIRDSKVSSDHISLDQGLDRSSLSQFTDASLPSHYSSHSIYTCSPGSYTPPRRQTTDIPSSSPGVHDRVRSLSEYSVHEHNHWAPNKRNAHDFDEQTYHDLAEDSPKPRMTSICEQTEEKETEDFQSHSPRPSSSQPTFYSEESDIGEPGSPVYANGDWAQVEERDRGILFDLPPTNPHSTRPDYAKTHDPHDTLGYLDPHVQSVLAAANAENMGLRGHPARGWNDPQRKCHASISVPGVGIGNKDDRPKQSFSQRKLRRFFSWRSGK